MFFRSRVQGWFAVCLVVLMPVPCVEASVSSVASMNARALAYAAAQATQSQPVSPTDSTPSTETPAAPQPSSAAASEQGTGIAGGSSSSSQENSSPPVGTAVAPYEKTTGVAASRPAGAVIAPAKQKRRRAFVVRVGLLVGAAVAVGTVVALSKGSPSHPN